MRAIKVFALALLSVVAASGSSLFMGQNAPTGGGGFDTDAQAYFNAITTAGSSITSGSKTAVNSFFVSAKANGYFTKLTVFNVMAGADLTAAIVQCQAAGGNLSATNNNFVGGDYTESTGLTADGTTKYLDTGFDASTTTANNSALVILGAPGTGAGSTNGLVMGTHWFGSNDMLLTVRSDNGNQDALAIMYGVSLNPFLGAVNYNKVWVLSRTSSTALVLYRDGASAGSSATAESATPHALNVYVGARNDAGSANGHKIGPYKFYAIASGLTSTDVTNLTADLGTLQTALGR